MSLRVAGRDAQMLLIVGYGRTGRALARFCVRRGLDFAVSESASLPESDLTWLAEHAVDVEVGGHTARLLRQVDAVIASPGAPADLPLFAAAAARGIPVVSELDLASAAMADRGIVAVTGTNGKSTTVSLIGALLERSGVRARVAGNIGLPFVEIIDERPEWSIAVLEVSSFQLDQSIAFHPQVGVLLNIAPNHLERHGTMGAYVAAKLRLFAHQTPSDVAILPSDLAGRLSHGAARLVVYDHPLPVLPRGSEEVGDVRRLDLAAAVCACREVVPDFDATRWSTADLESALFLPYRQELVGTVRGIRLINDSKATSAAATLAAVRATKGLLVLLLGGRSKRGGYDDLASALSAAPLRAAVVYGEAQEEIAGYLARAGVTYARARDLAEAVSVGLAAARSGDALLLSPACSSFDAFRSYEERGEAFNRIVRQLPGFQTAAPKDI